MQHTILIIPVLVVFLAVIVLRIINGINGVRYTSEAFSEKIEPISNPYMGFYQIIGYTLSDDNNLPDNYKDEILSYKRSLVLLEINLKNHRTTGISEKGIEQINSILSEWESSPNGTKLILRFLYDRDGIAYATEPESLSLILKHIEQIAKAVNQHSSCVYIMQGVFIGNWGEMHHSKFEDEKSVKQLMNKLCDVIDPSIYLSVRTPKQWRTVNCSQQPKSNTRIGLFNDGIMGSESDLGTYAENEREKELEFQNQLCRYVPNGGEVVFNQKLVSIESAVSALRKMQISYLNADYDSRVYEKWKSSVWQGDDQFNGCDGYTYIKSHVGYRFFIASSKIRKRGIINPKLCLSVTLINKGFSNTLKPFDTLIIFENAKTKECLHIPVDDDLTSLYGGNKKDLRIKLPLNEANKGEYLIYFCVNDKASGQRIVFANENQPQKNGILIGRLKK